MKKLFALLVLAILGLTFSQSETELFTDEASLVVLEEPEDTRVVQHFFGETEIPADPQRIVALHDQNVLLPLLQLDAGDRVIGSVGGIQDDGTEVFRFSQEGFDTSDITFLGNWSEPNLELILELEPDLIIGFGIPDRELPYDYDIVSEIAPTVIVAQFTRPIWGGFFDYALLVNAQDEAIALKTEYDERIAALQSELGDPSEITVSVVEPRVEGFVTEAQPFFPDITVINDIGLSIPRLRQEQIESGERPTLSYEVLRSVDGDVLYVMTFGPDASSETNSLIESPLYNLLGSVQADQAHLVDFEPVSGLTPQALSGWLDIFEETLLVDDLDRNIIQEEE